MRRCRWTAGTAFLGAAVALAAPAVAGEPQGRHGARGSRSATTHSAHDGSALRHAVAGGPTVDDVELGPDTPELRALREAERELFPPALPAAGPWPSDLPSPISTTDDLPRVHASGLPPEPPPSAPPVATPNLAWLAKLALPPDLPVRWDPRVVRYLQFFKDDPRGRATFTHFYKRAGRFRDMIQRTLRRKALPDDLVWVPMIESGFDAVVKSPAGAAGMWQFMPDAGKAYGLPQDRWVDMRLNPEAATAAAADFLADLQRRFGSWELALAAYDMGYGGMASIVRRYNTNDFWSLSRIEGALPWETTLYVPKILAVAIVARNLPAFGFDHLTADAPLDADEVRVPAGMPLATIASAAGCTTHEVETLNPELRASRTPPGEGDASTYEVKVPAGKGAGASAKLLQIHKTEPPLERYVVRFGETLEQIAQARSVTVQRLQEINGIGAGEVVRGGTVLLVPKSDARTAQPTASAASVVPPAQRPVVVVPAEAFGYPDRKRVFYRVLVGDTMKEIATAFHVTMDDLRRWNDLDPQARLVEGMTIQAFVPQAADLSGVVALAETDVRPLAVGSDEFLAYMEVQKGHKRITVLAKAGETLEQIGKRYNVAAKTMERINRRGRAESLQNGDKVVVYVATAPASAPR
jgi:membrane-bound lytic murein transglycosylase D